MEKDDAAVSIPFFQPILDLQYYCSSIINNDVAQLIFDHVSGVKKIVPLIILLFHSSNTKHSARNKTIIVSFIGLNFLTFIMLNVFIISWSIFLRFTFKFSFIIMVLGLGHWAATCPRSWHLWQTMPQLWEEEAAAVATEGASILATEHRCSCWIAGEEAVEPVVFATPKDGEGLAATPCDFLPTTEVPACCLRHGAKRDQFP